MGELSTVGVLLTLDQLAIISPARHTEVPEAHAQMLEARRPGLQRMLDLSGANTPLRAAGTLAEVAEESDGFRLVEEVPDPDDPHFLRYERGALGARLGNHEGDGALFPGADFLQSTGRANARKATAFARSMGIDVDFEAAPRLMVDPRYLGIASAAYIVEHGLNAVADQLIPAVPTSIDDMSCLVNAGRTLAQQLAVHGELLDGTEARAYNAARVPDLERYPEPPHLGPSKFGINGLFRRREHFKATCAAFRLA